jgi:hypothetical protein
MTYVFWLELRLRVSGESAVSWQGKGTIRNSGDIFHELTHGTQGRH